MPAESCLASQAFGATRHGSSAEVDRVLGVLGGELSGLVEASLPAAERCAVMEALLYLQVQLVWLGSDGRRGEGCSEIGALF